MRLIRSRTRVQYWTPLPMTCITETFYSRSAVNRSALADVTDPDGRLIECFSLVRPNSDLQRTRACNAQLVAALQLCKYSHLRAVSTRFPSVCLLLYTGA